MGRTSTKENKNSYQLAREELGLTREKASELLETIAPERIEKIENEKAGIVYHREGITGDYDDFDDPEKLIEFIRTGKH